MYKMIRVASLVGLGVLAFGMAVAPTAPAAVMLVSDTVPGRVLQYHVEDNAVAYTGVFSQGSLAGANLVKPMGMTLGRDGWVYLGEQEDQGRILRFAPDGTFLDVVAASQTGGFTNGRPESVEAGPDGNIYVTAAFGSSTSRVFKIDVGQAALPVTEFIPTSGAGYGTLSAPRGLSFGPDGQAYIADRNNNRILKFDGSSGAYLGQFGPTVTQPQDLYWHDGSLYVTSGSTVRRYDAAGTFVESYSAGSGTNIGLGSLGDAVYSVNWGDSTVYQRMAPDPAVAVVPTGEASEPAIGGNSFGHVLFYTPPEVAVLDTVGDAHVNLSNSANYGSLNRMRVGTAGGGDSTGMHEAFIGFDPSSIPADATIGNVMFRAVQTDGAVNANGFGVYEVTSAWDESTITGTNRPTVAGTKLGDMAVRLNTTPWNGVSTFQHANLTQLAQDWIGGYKGSHGLNFKMNVTNDGDTFASRENTSGYDAPQMVVTYELAGVYTKTVQHTGPLAYYRLSETAGPNARDATGDNHGTFSGVTLAQAGPNPESQPIAFRGMESINRGAQFNGSNSRVNLGYQIRDELATAAAEAISIEAWINAEQLGGAQFIAGTRINGGLAGAELYLAGDNLRMAGRSTGSDSYQNFNIDFLDAGGSLGEWHHVVGILDFAGKEIRIFVDGLLADTKTGVAFGSSVYTVGSSMTQPDSIGSSPDGGSVFRGFLDEVAFYPYALDAHPTLGNRVWTHYSAAVPEPGTGLLALLALLGLAGLRSRRRREA